MASERAQILITAVDQTKAALASVKANLEGLSNVAGKINGVLAGLGAALSVAGLVTAGKAALDTADNLSKLSQKTGISVESLSLLKPIAEQSGVSLEGLAKGMQKLANSMYDAASGSKEPLEAFQRLGVSFRDTAGQLRPTEDVLLELADAFAAMPDGAEKSALAVKLFGKAGVELIPFLNQGRAGIEQLKQQFKTLGLEISGDTARAAEKFNDTLDTVKQALSGIAMRVAEAALPALQRLADALVGLASHGDEILAVMRALGEVLVAVLAIKGVAAAARLLESVALLKAAFTRFLPILAAVAVWEMGKGLVKAVQDIRETNAAFDELARQRAQIDQLDAALTELAATGTVSVKTQMMLAALAAERLKAALPGTADALRAIQGAATQAGEAIRQALDAETKHAAETVKQLGASYKQVAADIKSVWDARVAEVEGNYKRQEAAAQSAARSESAAISTTTQNLLAAEREKLAAVEAGAKQMEAAWQASYGQAVALARAAGQDVAAIERQAVEARIALYGQIESAYRGTVDRLIAEEQRHLNAAKAAEEARLNLKLSVEDRIRELGRKGLDDYAAYQDRLRQIDEKQAQAKAALDAGNYAQARKLAEESVALAERSASAVTRQVEQNGKTVTQTMVSEGQAAATAIGQIKESAGIADAALKGLGDAHKQAATAAGAGADEAKRALASVSEELGKLRGQLLSQDKLKLEVDLSGAQAGIEKLQALMVAQRLVATIQADTKEAEASLAKLKTDAGNLTLVAQVEADTTKVMADIDKLKGTLSAARVEIPALVSFDQPRAQLVSFAQDARAVLSAPTTAKHTPQPDLGAYRAVLAELTRPTSSRHTIYVAKVATNAQGGLIERFAEGGQAIADGFRRLSGRILGPGTETSDSVPALLSHGEYVIRAASVRKFGEGFFAALNTGFLPHALPNILRFATGGAVAHAVAQAAMGDGISSTPARDVVDLRFHLGGRTHTVQSSRDTAMQLASALRELSRAG
ncbi:MAG: hypothetical protein Q8O33_05490 [Pseudomonadota bacterium]|nr:hypothetical protein [Pseudomonadota bacterium]